MWMLFYLAIGFVLFHGEVQANSEKLNDWLITKKYNLYPTLPNAAPFSRNEKCREDSRKLIENLKNNTLWAVQMWDSSATSTFGVLHGNSFQLGNFEECLAVTSPITSKYCLVKYKSRIHEEVLQNSSFNLTVWKAFQASRSSDIHVPRDEIRWALCVPASCSAAEMEKAINLYLDKINKDLIKEGISYYVEMTDDYCSGNTVEPYSFGEIGFWIFTGLVVSLGVLSSFIDINLKKDSAIRKNKAYMLLMSFSLKRNTVSLFETTPNRQNNPLMIFHGIKAVSIVITIMAHKTGYGLYAIAFNRGDLENILRSTYNVLLPQTDLVVDTFFFITAFITVYLKMEDVEKKRVNIVGMFFTRYIRLAPLYFYLIWAQATAIERLGSGPIWKIYEGRESKYCRKNWWLSFLFIQNYVNSEQMCLLHTWYLACDFQYLLLLLVFFFIIQRNRKTAIYLVYALMALSMLSTGIVTYLYQLLPIVKLKPGFLIEIRADASMQNVYIPSHTRATVFLIGMITAYHLFEKKNSTWRMSWITSLFTSIFGLAFFIIPMIYGGRYFTANRENNLVENAVFCTLRRTSWAFGWAIIMIVNRFGVIPVFGEVFSWSFWEPLSKLGYGLYLIHFVIATASISNLKIPQSVTLSDMFSESVSVLLFSLALAFITFLFLEQPIKLVVTKLLFRSPKPKQTNEKKVTSGSGNCQNKKLTKMKETRSTVESSSSKTVKS